MGVRRVVTGHDASGKSVFASDEIVDPDRPTLMPSAEFFQLWGGDSAPQFPDDRSMPPWRRYFPPVGGFRFGMLTLPPATGVAEQELLNLDEAVADIGGKLPGLLRYMDPTDPGMHATDTIDFDVVLDGTVVLELDDGAEVTLTPGDTVVQNGTRHRWKNPFSEPCHLVVFLVGAHHAKIGG